MKQYTKQIEGRTVIKPRNKIVVVANGRQYINPSEEILYADGWSDYVIPEPTAEELLQRTRQRKAREIERYDKSSAVEEFTLKDNALWLDRDERETLDRRFRLELKNGKTYSTLWKNGVAYELYIEQALAMLDVLEMYAIETYDTTQRHLAAVNALQSVDEIEQYDYKVGYPEKLSF